MSKIFKSNNIQIGTPKPIKNTITTIVKKKSGEDIEQDSESIIAESENKANSIIEDAKIMYLKIIEEANYEAKTIIDKAHVDKEEIYNNASQSGYEEGYNKGYKKSVNDTKEALRNASEIIDGLEKRKSEIYNNSEEEILNLVLDVSKKVIGDEIKQNKEAILSVITQGIEKCSFRSELKIRVSPEEYTYAVENKDKILRLIEGLSNIEIVSDVSLRNGGCVIETPSGDVNSSTYVQFRQIEKAFQQILLNKNIGL